MDERGRKVIVIGEPYKEILKNNSRFLVREDLDIHVVGSNTEVLIMQHKVQADLIVTGFEMPGLTCEEFCKNIRDDEDLKQVSIIIVCGGKEDVERCVNCKANERLSKNTAPDVFAATARKLLNVAERSALRVPVSIRVDGKYGKWKKPFLGFSENMSATGMMVESDKVLESGEIIMCSFYLDNNTQIIANAEVVRAMKKGPGHGSNKYGIKFSGLSGGVLDAIDAYVKDRGAEK